MKVRTFSDEFKAKIVEMVAADAATQTELSRKYGISPVMIGRWKREYSTRKFFENINNFEGAAYNEAGKHTGKCKKIL